MPAHSRTAWIFLTPWLLGLAALTAAPFAVSLYWSFCEYDLLSPPRFVGLENYRRLGQELAAGEGFGKAMWNTAYFAVVSVGLSVGLGLALAVIAAGRGPGRAAFRAVVYLPSVLPVVATSVLWMWLLDPRGPVNALLASCGLGGPHWLRSQREALWLPDWFSGRGDFGGKDALALMAVWTSGNIMVIFLAALQNVPRSLYEAAQLDGAGRLRRFWHITLPLLSPVIFFNALMGLVKATQAFTQIYLVSEGRGEPVQSTLMLSLHIFLAAFGDLEMGYASAVAWALFLLLAALVAAMFRTARHWVFYAGAPS